MKAHPGPAQVYMGPEGIIKLLTEGPVYVAKAWLKSGAKVATPLRRTARHGTSREAVLLMKAHWPKIRLNASEKVHWHEHLMEGERRVLCARLSFKGRQGIPSDLCGLIWKQARSH